MPKFPFLYLLYRPTTLTPPPPPPPPHPPHPHAPPHPTSRPQMPIPMVAWVELFTFRLSWFREYHRVNTFTTYLVSNKNHQSLTYVAPLIVVVRRRVQTTCGSPIHRSHEMHVRMHAGLLHACIDWPRNFYYEKTMNPLIDERKSA